MDAAPAPRLVQAIDAFFQILGCFIAAAMLAGMIIITGAIILFL